MIKIAYVIDELPSANGGTEGQLVMLLRHLDRTQFAPHLVCLRPADFISKSGLDVPNLTLHVGSLFRPSAIRKINQLGRYLRENKIDIVQTFFVDGNIVGTFGAMCAGTPTIISSRRNLGHWHGPIHIALLKYLQKHTSYYLANSRAVIAKTIDKESAKPEQMHLVYNGLDLERFARITPELRAQKREEWKIGDNELLVGSVANLRDVKNLDLLVIAAATLKNDYPNLKWVIVGDGPDRERLTSLLAQHGLADRFLLPGRAVDVIPSLAALDIAVLCSASESFSNSLIEYMAAGLPVIASDVGGNREAISHGENGLLFPSGDQARFNDELRQLIGDRGLAARFASAARTAAHSKYSTAKYVAEHEAFYRRIYQEKADR
ncbi:MAG: glycosyltransferase [bacterium]|nr:glycosyltransferase [bacterium]